MGDASSEMTSLVAVCILGVLTLVAFNFQSAEPKIDTWKDFEAFEDEELEGPALSWLWMLQLLQRIVVLLLAVIGGPLVMIVLQQRSILYRPEVAGRRISTGQKANPVAWGLDYESFFFTSRDGTKLHAWLLSSRKEVEVKKPAILFFHSNAGDIPQRLDFFSRMCRQLNVVILAMEYRGFGRSDDAEISEESMVEDASCAYQWLVNYAVVDSSQVDPEQIYVFGRSLGGCVTVRLVSWLLGVDGSARSPPTETETETSTSSTSSKLPLPAGIVLENSPNCIADVATHMLPFLRLVPRSLLTWPLLLDEWRSSDWLDWIGQVLSKDAKSLQVCLLSAAQDKVVPPSCMEDLRRVGQKHRSLEVSFHSFQRGDHMGTYLLAGEHYWHCLRHFLDDDLDGSEK